jgi:hypothetical protein
LLFYGCIAGGLTATIGAFSGYGILGFVGWLVGTTYEEFAQSIGIIET